MFGDRKEKHLKISWARQHCEDRGRMGTPAVLKELTEETGAASWRPEKGRGFGRRVCSACRVDVK